MNCPTKGLSAGLRTFELPILGVASQILIFSLMACLFVCSAEGTELRLQVKDEQGQQVRLSKAELLLVAWGDADRLGLATEEQLVVPLDEAWLRARWPSRFADMEKVYLFLQADGYAAVRSEPFLWIGAHGPPYDPRVTKAEIAFLGGKKVVVEEGDTAELELVLRRPKERYLRLIDDHGKPVAGVKVSSYVFWSASNHCGHLSGADALGKAVSDVNGRVRISDGDFEYAFEVEKQLYVLKHPGSLPYIPPRLITYLNADETSVAMHRWRWRPLEMHVTKNGKPVVGQVLLGRLAGCPCGACDGPVGLWNTAKTNQTKTDKNGRIHIPDFYPEEWEEVFFVDAKGGLIWEADPTKWPRNGTIHIELEPNDGTAADRPAPAAEPAR